VNTLENIRLRASERNAHILLGDAADERILRAAVIAQKERIASVTLLGDEAQVHQAADEFGIPIRGLPILNPDNTPLIEELIDRYYHTRQSKISDLEAARSEVHSDILLFGSLLVSAGYADGMVAGAVSTTAQVIRAGLRGIGLSPDMRVLSSMFLMVFPPVSGLRDETMVFAFADGAVIPQPDAYQLADIAVATSNTYQQLTGYSSRIAMLSYSTKGSASGDEIRKVVTATEIVKERKPDLLIDGELQFDAAFVPEVAMRKAPDSPLAGDANVFIFPNLDAANIGYKLAERLGGGQAIGPILQGLAQPCNDLSRGAKTDDIVTMIAVTALQSVPSNESL
jgi:phosphate acetyltransferase